MDDFRPTEEDYAKFKALKIPKFAIYGGKDCFFTVKNLEGYADNIGAVKLYDPNGVHGTIKENVTRHKLLHEVISKNFI